MQTLSLAFSTCPNDTFMMYALVHERINMMGIRFKFTMMDIEQLNRAAFDGKYDVTKASAAILPKIHNKYNVFDAGAAFGLEGGPLLICRDDIFEKQPLHIIIPGENTSAKMLFERYYHTEHTFEYAVFSDIFGLMASGRADAGVIIHEDRFTFHQHGFECLLDLGAEWMKETSLPVPLGVFLGNKNCEPEVLSQVNMLIKRSIEYARANPNEVMPWIQEFARNEHPDVIRKHINWYVNKLSDELVGDGEKALKLLHSVQGNALTLQPKNGFYTII